MQRRDELPYCKRITLAVSREQEQLGNCCINPGEKRGGSDRGRYSGGGGEWLDFGSILKGEPTGFPDGLGVGCEKKGGGDITSKVLA